MIKRVFVNEFGKVISIICGSDVDIDVNTIADLKFYDLKEGQQVNIGDYFQDDKLVFLSEKPSIYHEFNYELKQWFDPRSIDQIKEQKWLELRHQRDALEFGGFEFEGDIYDSDQVSQVRISGAANAAIDQAWTLANNSIKYLTTAQLRKLYQTLQAHVASVHERGRIARQLIYDAETHEQINQIQL
ncbi:MULTISPECIES: DUF4376 domain-containing protein [unclassified Acinetobacter]|uniref:DUF4376 domain-containing protein n=1 Tax=unclassified Acinetobacter TaxID=196816 RepID=UPI0029350658|nr:MULTISPECIES: DUF4376 domain-containing protein [unclassified Acinetobacter]WOE32735.1 DUF4376 domain-containing protein [Acinetobacter sp. SAAs470]WOE38211.1 DUF4376 domain-containing protein [Acinetobacter sp. SAAs474]